MSGPQFATEQTPVTAPSGSAAILEVSGLRIDFATANGYLNVVDDVSFQVCGSETLALVGESGSGKTVSALSIMGLLPARSCRIAASRMQFCGRDLLSMDKEEIRNLRGNEISMIFQEPMTSLNPSFTVGNQIVEAIRVHRHVSKAKARRRALEVLDLVGIADPRRRLDDYPHALSGGMRQRAMIAMALACEPKLLIADEPTTALDVTIQAQVLELLRRLQNELGMSILFVTHDLGVVAEIADRITVLYAGQTVEVEPVEDLFKHPHHPYSEALMASMPQVAAVGQPLTVIPGHVPRPGEFPDGCRFHPRCSHAADVCKTGSPEMGPRTRCIRDGDITLNGSMWTPVRVTLTPGRTSVPEPAALLDVRDLAVSFPVHSGVLRRTIGHVKAVDGVSFSIAKGQTMGLVGESGSGKSTTARLVLRLIEPSAGTIRLGELDVTSFGKTDLRRARARMQIVFQDPYSSLDPRSTIAETIGEPLEVHEGLHGRARDERVRQLLKDVGLDPRVLTRYPHRILRGPATADRCRPGTGARARAADMRRARELARCFYPVPGHQSARRAPGPPGFDVLIHCPRFVGGETHKRSHRRHVPGTYRRDRSGGACLHRAEASIYRSPAVGYTCARSGRTTSACADCPQRRHPQSHQPTLRVPIPYEVSVRHGGLFRSGSASVHHRRWNHRVVPSTHNWSGSCRCAGEPCAP